MRDRGKKTNVETPLLRQNRVKKNVPVTAIVVHAVLPEAMVNEMYDSQGLSIDHFILVGKPLDCVKFRS